MNNSKWLITSFGGRNVSNCKVMYSVFVYAHVCGKGPLRDLNLPLIKHYKSLYYQAPDTQTHTVQRHKHTHFHTITNDIHPS